MKGSVGWWWSGLVQAGAVTLPWEVPLLSLIILHSELVICFIPPGFRPLCRPLYTGPVPRWTPLYITSVFSQPRSHRDITSHHQPCIFLGMLGGWGPWLGPPTLTSPYLSIWLLTACSSSTGNTNTTTIIIIVNLLVFAWLTTLNLLFTSFLHNKDPLPRQLLTENINHFSFYRRLKDLKNGKYHCNYLSQVVFINSPIK